MKLKISDLTFTLAIALFFASVQNMALWIKIWGILISTNSVAGSIDWGFLLSIPFLIIAICYALFSLLVWPYIYKLITVIIITLSTLATYTMVSYGQYFNYDMIVNVFETNPNEATSYLSLSLMYWILLLCIVPVIAIIFTKVTFPSTTKKLIIQKTLALLTAFIVIIGIASLYYKEYASLVRNNSEIKSLINPTNYLSAMFRYAKYRIYEHNMPFKVIGTDAYNTLISTRPNVVVLVIGETSRAMNYSLNGYLRNTNPRLSKENVISFRHVTSCGTATAISLPCMFSLMTHDDYDATIARHQEGVLDVLKHAGIDVHWKDNNGGCKGVCDRIEHLTISPDINKAECPDGTCYDSVLLNTLPDNIKNVKHDTLIVLHLIGSHGPTYYKRYPKNFRLFTPTCDTANIQNCSREAILNTYDNTVVYTDYVLSEVINILKQNDIKHNTALLYLSDHGESLGENGIYLHGLPYSIAPKEQIEIPLILWMSPSYERSHNVNHQCVTQLAQDLPFSHDNLFHTLLGMMSVTTKVYQPAMDILSNCKQKTDQISQ